MNQNVDKKSELDDTIERSLEIIKQNQANQMNVSTRQNEALTNQIYDLKNQNEELSNRVNVMATEIALLLLGVMFFSVKS